MGGGGDPRARVVPLIARVFGIELPDEALRDPERGGVVTRPEHQRLQPVG